MGIAVTPYYSYVSDYIDVRRCPTQVCGDTQAVIDSLTARQGFVYLQFINQDAQLFGVDVAGRALLAENTRFGTFTARGLVSYVEGTNIVTDDHLYHMMPVNGKIALEQRVGRWTIVIETVLVGEKFLVSQVHNEVETGAYALLNLRSSYQWNNLRVDYRERVRYALRPAAWRALSRAGSDDGSDRHPRGRRSARHGTLCVCRDELEVLKSGG
jgi:iron complex outermembrane recepter protein